MFSLEHLSLEEGCKKEWLVSNGLGGYSSSTVIGLNSRKYHGLLVAALNPPVNRWLLLSKLEEELLTGGGSFSISTNKYIPGTIYPRGYEYQTGFVLDFFPTFSYDVYGLQVKKKIYTIYGFNAVVVSYEAVGEGEMRIRPLVNCRSFHSNLHRRNLGWDFIEEISRGIVKLTPDFINSPTLMIASDLAEFFPNGCWYHDMVYDVEGERGYDDTEDHYSPGEFRIRIEGREKFNILAVGGRKVEGSFRRIFSRDSNHFEGLFKAEVKRKKNLVKGKKGTLRKLTLAADSFIVKRGRGKSIIAGYHWFDDWGRDTMISLPGLTLATERFGDSKEILETFCRASKHGLIPNRFTEDGDPEYNSADASLWFFYAVDKYLEYTQDLDFIRYLWPTMCGIIEAYRGGINGIRMESDHLIWSPSQYTWMDAQVNGKPVTPREGKVVEINALWYNSLKIAEKISRKLGYDSASYSTLAEKTMCSFNEKFWNINAGCLFDVVRDGENDPSIRSNQILAVSLPYSMLSKSRAKRVVAVVEKDLLTPYGLRTLSPRESEYKGTYYGNQESRDLAYHQGTVWPWLLGHFITAYRRVNGNAHVKKFLNKLVTHLNDSGLGSISEIFDGDPPYAPKGAISQAWSVAEVLRCYTEEFG